MGVWSTGIVILTVLVISWVRIVTTLRREERQRIAAWEKVARACRIARLEHEMRQSGHDDGPFHPRDWNGLGTHPYVSTCPACADHWADANPVTS